MFHAGGNMSAGLVEAARGVGAFVIFMQCRGGGGHRNARVDLDARRDNRTIRRVAAMGASAGVDANRVARLVRAALSPRRATVAGVEYLRTAHGSASP